MNKKISQIGQKYKGIHDGEDGGGSLAEGGGDAAVALAEVGYTVGLVTVGVGATERALRIAVEFGRVLVLRHTLLLLRNGYVVLGVASTGNARFDGGIADGCAFEIRQIVVIGLLLILVLHLLLDLLVHTAADIFGQSPLQLALLTLPPLLYLRQSTVPLGQFLLLLLQPPLLLSIHLRHFLVSALALHVVYDLIGGQRGERDQFEPVTSSDGYQYVIVGRTRFRLYFGLLLDLRLRQLLGFCLAVLFDQLELGRRRRTLLRLLLDTLPIEGGEVFIGSIVILGEVRAGGRIGGIGELDDVELRHLQFGSVLLVVSELHDGRSPGEEVIVVHVLLHQLRHGSLGHHLHLVLALRQLLGYLALLAQPLLQSLQVIRRLPPVPVQKTDRFLLPHEIRHLRNWRFLHGLDHCLPLLTLARVRHPRFLILSGHERELAGVFDLPQIVAERHRLAEQLMTRRQLLQTQQAEVLTLGSLQEESAGEVEVYFVEFLRGEREEETLAAVAAQQGEGGGDGSEVQGEFLGGFVLVVGGSQVGNCDLETQHPIINGLLPTTLLPPITALRKGCEWQERGDI